MIYKQVIVLDFKIYNPAVRLLSSDVRTRLVFQEALDDWRYCSLLSDYEMITVVPPATVDQDELLKRLESLAFKLRLPLEIQ